MQAGNGVVAVGNYNCEHIVQIMFQYLSDALTNLSFECVLLTVDVHIGGPVAALVGERTDATVVMLFASIALLVVDVPVCGLAAEVQVLDGVRQN